MSSESASFASFDGMLFTPDLSAVLFVPANKEGTAHLPDTLETVPAKVLSHSTQLSSLVIGKGCVSFTTKEGILYSKDEKTLIACPAGIATAVVIPECVEVIGPQAFLGCEITSIVSQGRLTSLADSAFSDTAKQTAVVALASTDAYEEQKALWLAAGFTHFNEPAKPGAIQKPDATHSGFVFELLDDYTLSVSWQGSDDPDVNLEIPSSAMIDGVSYRVSHVAEGAFQNRSSLESVSIPAGVTTVGNAAFEGCTALVSVDLPEGLLVLGSSSFEDTALVEVILPSSVSSIQDRVFADVLSLVRIIALSDISDIAQSALQGCTNVSVLTPYREDGAYLWSPGLPSSGIHVEPYGIDLLDKPLVLSVGTSSDLFEESVREVPEGCEVAYSYPARSVSVDAQGMVTGKAVGSAEVTASVVFGEIVLSNSNRVLAVTDFVTESFTSGSAQAKPLPKKMPLSAVPLSVSGGEISQYASVGVGSIVSCTTANDIVMSFYVTKITGSTGEVWVGKNGPSGGAIDGAQAISRTTVGHVEIPERFEAEGISWLVVGTSSEAFTYCANITSVTVSDTVTVMNRGTFSACSNLVSIVIGKSVTTLGSLVFHLNTRLATIYVKTSKITSVGTSFTSNPTVYLPPGAPTAPWTNARAKAIVSAYTITFDVQGGSPIPKPIFVTPGSKAVEPTPPSPPSGLSNYVFDGWFTQPNGLGVKWNFRDTAVSESMTLYAKWSPPYVDDGIFRYGKTDAGDSLWVKLGVEVDRTSLTEAVIPAEHDYFNEGNLPVTEIADEGFESCPNLSVVTIPSSIRSIGISGFSQNDALSSVIFDSPHGDSVLQSIGASSFSGCVALQRFPWDSIPELKSIGVKAFSGSGLTSIAIPDSVTSLGNEAFSFCLSLANASTGLGTPDLPVSLFEGCGKLSSVVFSPNTASFGASVFKQCALLTDIVIPGTVKTVGNFAFAESGLRSIAIPLAVTSLGESTFSGCKSLTTVSFDMPSSLIELSPGLFSGSGLRSVTLPEGIQTIGEAVFKDCKTLASVTLPSTTKTFGSTSFNGCETLKTFDATNSALTAVADFSFQGCTLLNSVILPDTVSTIGSSAFADCSRLSSFESPSSLVSIGVDAFARSGVASVLLSPSGSLSVGQGAFADCGSLTSIVLNPATTGVLSLGSNAFADSYNLSFLRIGSMAHNLTFASGSFMGCLSPSLNSLIVCVGTATNGSIQGTAFDSAVKKRVSVALAVNDGLNQTAWKTAGFTTFGSAIEHSLVFDLGYVGCPTPPDSQILYESQKATKPKDPYRAGYLFVGWFAEGSSVPWDFTVDCMGMTDIKLIAQWQQGDDPQPISVDVSLTDAIALDAQGKTMKEAPLKFTSQTADSSIYLASIACTLSQDASNPVFGNSAKGVTLSARSVAGPESGTGALAGCILSFGPSTLPSFVMTTQNATAEALLSLGLDESSIVNYGPEARSVATLVCTFGRG